MWPACEELPAERDQPKFLTDQATPLCFSISVQCPATHPGQRSALEFTRTLLTTGHSVAQVFFYLDGVEVALLHPDPPPPQAELLRDWVVLKAEFPLLLAVCAGSATRRGLPQSGESGSPDLHPDFELLGLGQLIESISNADRCVSFAR